VVEKETSAETAEPVCRQKDEPHSMKFNLRGVLKFTWARPGRMPDAPGGSFQHY
jgi:hypothetical protein